MSAEVVRNPQHDMYSPEHDSGLMVECSDCGIEWGWGGKHETLQGYADEHNADQQIPEHRRSASPDCNCAPDESGTVVHNSWAHPERTPDLPTTERQS